MSTKTYDFHDFITSLTDAGMEKKHAKAIVEGVRKLERHHHEQIEDVVKDVVTPDYLDKKMAQMEVRMLKWNIPLFLGQYGLLIILIMQLFRLMGTS